MTTPVFAHHGGRMDDAARAYPGAPLPWIDLSTGINPQPWGPPADLCVDAAPLPTTAGLRALEAAAARFFGVDGAHVAAVPGSEIALRMLPALGLPAPIATVVPSYGTHADVADISIDRHALAARRGGTLLIANPNNPDGLAMPPSRLIELAQRQAGQGGWLVVDEAFADVDPGLSVLADGDGRLPLVVLRSFGKFFGLAGVRLGFVVAPAAVIDRVRVLLGDWPVGAQAIAWGSAAYADVQWIASARASLYERAARLDALLARHGMTPRGECPLFRLVERPDALDLFDRLARRGILTRPFAGRADWLRFGLPADEAAFARLDRALADD